MRCFLAAVLLVLAAVSTASAQGWDVYDNARFGYRIDLPPNFVGEGEAVNGDGQVFRSADGTQLLRVFGGHALDGFEERARRAMSVAREEGWNLSYERLTPSWTSFSGTRNGMIVYARAIALCGGEQFASFELRYPEGDLDAMHRVVERLVSSLKPTGTSLSC